MACGDDDSRGGAQRSERDADADADAAMPETSPLKATRLAASDASYPFGAADHNRRPMDLAARDYLEEEFIVEGRAKTYEWPESGGVSTRTEPSPYATRVLVRRPNARAKFSGRVVVELLNPTNRFDLQIGWALSHEHFMREGDAWIGITSKPISVVAMQQFDAERYAALSWANPLSESSSRNCEIDARDLRFRGLVGSRRPRWAPARYAEGRESAYASQLTAAAAIRGVEQVECDREVDRNSARTMVLRSSGRTRRGDRLETESGGSTGGGVDMRAAHSGASACRPSSPVAPTGAGRGR